MSRLILRSPRLYRRVAVSAPSGPTLDLTNLAAWWPFNGDFNDDHTNGLDLNNNNSVGFTASGGGPGGVGVAADFDAASSQYLDHADDAALDISGDYSIGFWVYLTTIASDQGIIDKVNEYAFYNETSAAGYPRFRHQTSQYGQTADNTNDITTGAWQHFAFRYDATAQTIEYAKNNQSKTTLSSVSVAPTAGTSALNIGRFLGTNYLTGNLAEMWLFKRKITDLEWSDIYNNGVRRTLADFN